MKKIEKNTKKLLKNVAVSGVVYFLVILVTSYFFIYPNFAKSLRYAAVSTLIFVPLILLLNKFFNKKYHDSRQEN
jgi:hypothetical protein